MKSNFILISLFFIFNSPLLTQSQSFLNGDFEINSATPGVDAMNLSNANFNSLVSFTNSFGNANANLDLITTDYYSGLAQSGEWFIGIQGGSIDLMSLELSDTIHTGNTHQISFYDRGRESQCSTPFEIGLSNNPNAFGTVIYTSPEAPIPYLWLPRVFSFTAPHDGKYVTVRGIENNCWNNIDNFCIDTICVPEPFVQMPNVFSPTNDGYNEIFRPIHFDGVIKSQLQIYNRWGKLIWETDNLLEILTGWNGKNDQDNCSDGIYYWVLQYTTYYNDSFTETGTVTLLR